MKYIFNNDNNEAKIQKIQQAFFTLASDHRILAEFPEIEKFAEKLRTTSLENDSDETELAFLNLYCELHRTGGCYSQSERQLLDGKKGYFNHPGGISPLVKAESFIETDSVVADLGAGNGLQGLLFQYLYPHRTTLQIELSSEMIRIGQMYQEVLEIPEEKVVWINDDIMNISLDEIDFMYLYRPSKPIKNGIQLYDAISRKLRSRKRSLVIFSIADCLRDFLDSSFSLFYTDGHLTCFEKNVA
ncbi:MAG: class I SAM-dependent methyltransferase [Proteobacteria bacterium]|nr:class I SAM-dependent methyltransferase [Pseudomonadota bacterium]